MRQPQYTLTRTQVQVHAAAVFQTHLRLHDYGRKATTACLLHVLFAAAAWVTSLHDACQRLRGAPSDETIRQALFATLPHYQELQRRLNRALAADLPKTLRRRRRKLALDLTLLPYHGAPQERAEEIYRGRPKAGTGHFHAYATAYVVHKGRRYTLALTGVWAGEPLADVVRRLLRQTRRTGVRPRLMLLDREFGMGPVIRSVRAARYPFVVGLRRRGRKPDHPKGASGTWALCQRQPTSGWTTYVWQDKDGRRVRLAVCVVYRWRRDRRGRRKRKVELYGCGGVRAVSPGWLREVYRGRFGIESSYRQLNQARIRTSTRSPLLRLLFVGLALVLRNVWVWVHEQVLAGRRRGGRVYHPERRRFRPLLDWLRQVAEQALGVCDRVAAERPPPPACWAA
jgi:hypothetical protein